MLRLMTAISLILSASVASAAPRCLDLNKKQAEKAVSVARIALDKGSALIFQTSKEGGLVVPMGVWTEAKKRKNGKTTYRVLVDGREVDISLVYVAKSPDQRHAYNLAWMAGCQPAPHKPNSIPNW